MTDTQCFTREKCEDYNVYMWNVCHLSLCSTEGIMFYLVRPVFWPSVPRYFFRFARRLNGFWWYSRVVITYHEQIKSLHFGRNWNRIRDVDWICGDVRQVLLGLGRWCLTVLLDLGRECLAVLLTGRLYALSHQWLRRMKCVKHTVPRWWDWVQILCFLRATFQDAAQLPHTHIC